MSTFERPRLSIEISQQQATALRQMFPWGTKNAAFNIIINDLIRMYEKFGNKFIGALIAESITLGEFLSVEVPEDDKN